MRSKGRALGAVVIAILVLAVYGLTKANVCALPAPGPAETWFAVVAGDWLIARVAKRIPPADVPLSADSISKGKALYSMACASCHGLSGLKPSPIGQAMYPLATSLASPLVQRLSDGELYRVISNGVQLTGMPGFANIYTRRQIWQIVYYIRRLRGIQ
jgi:mono/diheme cytochrome c family protein